MAEEITKLFVLVHPRFTKPSREQVEKWKEIIDFVIDNKNAALQVLEPNALERKGRKLSLLEADFLQHLDKAVRLTPERISSRKLPDALSRRSQLEVFVFGKRAAACVRAQAGNIRNTLSVPSRRIHIYPRMPYSDNLSARPDAIRITFPPSDVRSSKYAADVRRYKEALHDYGFNFKPVPSIDRMLRSWRAKQRKGLRS